MRIVAPNLFGVEWKTRMELCITIGGIDRGGAFPVSLKMITTRPSADFSIGEQTPTLELLGQLLGGEKLAGQVWDQVDGDLWRLAGMDPEELLGVRGMGTEKAGRLLASWELGRRLSLCNARRPDRVLNSSAEAAHFLQPQIAHLDHEVFCVLYLNRALRLIRMERISQGGITGTVADPRIIFRKALALRSVSLILAHNHPSGSLYPSVSDRELTSKICQAAEFLDMTVNDHLIVSRDGYYSFADEGLL
jgi:DNA repair protein RadC